MHTQHRITISSSAYIKVSGPKKEGSTCIVGMIDVVGVELTSSPFLVGRRNNRKEEQY